MNKIEEIFYAAWTDYWDAYRKYGIRPIPIRAQVPCGGYIIDFVVYYPFGTKTKIAVEIDGQETHKTKAQRLNDYARERFLMAKNMLVIRFTASEIYVDARDCVKEVMRIAYQFEEVIQTYTDAIYDEAFRLGADVASGRIHTPK